MNKYTKYQKGAETLELVVIFPIFFVLIIFVFEIARALYVWNLLDEATRRGARIAVVCPNGYEAGKAYFEDYVKNAAAFDVLDGSGISPLVHGLTRDDFEVKYYDLNGVEVDSETVTSEEEANIKDIKLAKVWLKQGSYQFDPILDLFGEPFSAPEFTTILYAESKGAVPNYPGEDANDPDCNF